MNLPASIEETRKLLSDQSYIADRGLTTAIYLALRLRRPLFLEGEAGVGKTEVAKVLARGLGRELIRLQCYEGLDVPAAVYEWNYARQMIEIRLAEAAGVASKSELEESVFSPRFLVERPLLRSIRGSRAPVLLIDEIDRADEPFEAYLLELLSDYQISIPELGVIRAETPPIVVITSNRTREVHDALKRRCFYFWIDYPSRERELEILRARAPHLPDALARQVVHFVQGLREQDLHKPPGVAETLDWLNALAMLEVSSLDVEVIKDTLGVLCKYEDDVSVVDAETCARILGKAAAG
jgi:MoxR-like ATPase